MFNKISTDFREISIHSVEIGEFRMEPEQKTLHDIDIKVASLNKSKLKVEIFSKPTSHMDTKIPKTSIKTPTRRN